MRRACLSFGQAVRGTIVRGVVPAMEDKVAEIGAHMRSGRLDALQPGDFGIVLGAELARALGVLTGDKLVLIAPQGQVTPAGVIPRLKQFTVVGIFEVGMFEYDSGLALIDLSDAQRVFQMGDTVSGVRLKLDDLFAARAVAREVMTRFDSSIYATDWTRSHANFFRAVEIEKRVMFIILLLIVAVAAFNIVSTLVMAVTDKQADIAILRTLGASPSGILQIFVVQGVLIGVIGTLIGLVGGVADRDERGCRGAGARAPVQRPVPLQGRLLHQRSAFGRTVVRRGGDLHRLAVAVPDRDAVPELARLARESRGGPAL